MTDGQDTRFSQGDILAGCYLIQEYLGGGAMGDVYHALNLNQHGKPIALKVPRPSHPDYDTLKKRLTEEVDKAQSVTHPNVCRVNNIAMDRERDLVLLSMELLDGRTLEEILVDPSCHLSREGKILLVHDLCAGLAAIHAKDLIHRDLKPSNIMIDREGRAKILDFGLATRTRELFDSLEGTRSYMAPEQIDGEGVTRQSDLYALGLVLYEIFFLDGTDPEERPDWSEESEREKARARLTEIIQNARHVGGELRKSCIEASLAQMLLDCLEEEPERRPSAIEEIVRTLPPGRKIPTRVEYLLANPPGGLSRRQAWSCLAGTVLGLMLVAFLSQWVQPTQTALSGERTAELEIRAHEILGQLGFDSTRNDRTSGFTYHQNPERPVLFWYRQSARRLAPWRKGSAFRRYEDPPFSTPGEVGIHLDPQGRLVRLDAVPQRKGDTPGGRDFDAGNFDWSQLVTAAGLDLDRLQPASAEWTPPVFADQQAAWVRGDSEAAGRYRVEAAALRGRPVAFRVLYPEPTVPRLRANAEEARRGPSAMSTLVHGFGFGGVLIGVMWLAWRRLREHLADKSAAFHLAFFVFVARVLVGLFGARHVWSPLEFDLTLAVFSRALLSAALVWVIYIAVEPWVRLYSPDRAASWIRVMYGNLDDPLVGRDLVVGGLFGLSVLLWARLYVLVPSWLGLTPPRLDRLSTLVGMLAQEEIELQLEALSSFPRALGMAIYALVHGVLLALLLVSALVLLRWLLHDNLWLSRSACFLLYLIMIFPGAGHPVLDLMAAAGTAALGFTVLFRFGFLPFTTATVFTWVLSSHPLTLDPTNWAFPGALVPVLLTLGISVWGFWASLGDESPLPVGLLRPRQQTG